MTRVNADSFISLWKEFSEDFTTKHRNWRTAYNNNTDWSRMFLGTKRSSNEGSPIGDFFRDKKGLQYRTEDGSFDLCFSSAKNYKNIPYISKNEILQFDVDEFYPASYDIILEIENNCDSAWREMTKLTWVHCPLKVLVTYNNKWEKENDMLIESFKTIIGQSNTTFKENPDTEYLLIIGNSSDETLNWNSYKFDSEGDVVNGITN